MLPASSTNPSDWLAEFPPVRSLPLDPEALRIYERAYYIGLKTEEATEPPITFSTVALALLTGEDETSRWFGRLAQTHGPKPDAVAAEKKTTISAVPAAEGQPGRPAELRLSSDKQLLTSSARAVLETAEEWASRVGGSDIGVRHLVAAYVINPPAAHRRQMNEWGLQERSWRQEFFDWVGKRYTAESWGDAKQRVAPTKAVAAFEQPRVKGAALAFPGDAQTMQVLNLASQYHARRPDPWLRLQTVFFALVEQARNDAALRSEVAPIWAAVSAGAGRYQAALAAYLASAGPPRAAAAFSALDISPRVLNGLETARELALATRHDAGSVGALQLAGALISRRVDADDDLSGMGLDPARLRLALIAHAAARGDSGELWREALGEEEPAPTVRPVDLNSDEPETVVRKDEAWARDPLGIRPDVLAFAALLASRSLEPPLAIGLFGPWGSGKTTFLKRLRLAIDRQVGDTDAGPASTTPSPFVRNVVHVEFNAWHFAEDALVSSLVDTIVREIKAFIKNEHPAIGDALTKLRSETADVARQRLEAARREEAEARAAMDEAATALAENQARARDGVASLQAAMQAVWAATVAAVKDSPVVKDSQLLDKIGGAVQSAEALQDRVQAIRSRTAPMLGELGWPRSLGFAALVLVVPPVMAWLVGRLLGVEGVAQGLSSAGAVVSVVTLWLRAASGAAAKVEQAVGEVTQAYGQRLRDDPAVKQAEQALADANAKAGQAAAALAAAEAQLRSAQSAASAASLPSQMLALVSARADDMTYAKELTTVSVARGDLQTLSKILRDQTVAQAGSAAGSPGLKPVDRVVLYIDDLDRCRPDQVVRVLQVVHMLLAFELFVVVVAVDARWVEESLKKNYRWLAGADGGHAAGEPDEESSAGSARVTPQDYLEKIFQISFWLEPMTAGRAAEYMKSLVRAMPRDVGLEPPPGGTAAEPGAEGTARVDILPIELDYMRALAAYVGPSPRRVKRLVNAYRLLKARMSDLQLASFITDRSTDDGRVRSGPYQLVIGLLVIGTGASATAAEILNNLAERDPRDTFAQVIDEYRERRRPDWIMAAQVLETLMRTQKADDLSELRGWARRVGRFLLQGPTDIRSNPPDR